MTGAGRGESLRRRRKRSAANCPPRIAVPPGPLQERRKPSIAAQAVRDPFDQAKGVSFKCGGSWVSLPELPVQRAGMIKAAMIMAHASTHKSAPVILPPEKAAGRA